MYIIYYVYLYIYNLASKNIYRKKILCKIRFKSYTHINNIISRINYIYINHFIIMIYGLLLKLYSGQVKQYFR